MKAYLDWRLSGDTEWLRRHLARASRRPSSSAWVAGGWDADRDGVMEGVQHNTYDVEFYGPNPHVRHLLPRRACAPARRWRAPSATPPAPPSTARLFESGSKWIDANLFNGEYYIQKVRGIPKDTDRQAPCCAPWAPTTPRSPNSRSARAAWSTSCRPVPGRRRRPRRRCSTPPRSARRSSPSTSYNYKRSLRDHDSVQRIYALNDEAALVICDYGKARRARAFPFPYYAEACDRLRVLRRRADDLRRHGRARASQCVENVRRRYDGERRNPWDEPECGHHYARAMAAWTPPRGARRVPLLRPRRVPPVQPLRPGARFQCFWSAASGWGTFTLTPRTFRLDVLFGSLEILEVSLPNNRKKTYSDRIRLTESNPLVLA